VVGFDARRLEVRGDPVVMASNVTSRLVISNRGTLTYEPVPPVAGPRQAVWVDRRGVEEPLDAPPSSAAGYLRLSPNNERLAMTSAGEVRVWTLAGRTETRLVEGRAAQWDATWMPDGRHLVFSTGTQIAPEIVIRAADGSGTSTRLVAAGGWPNAVSPDGKHLVYHVGIGTGLMVKPLDPPGEPWQLEPNALNGAISPDGNWIAYESRQSSPPEIHVRRFPEAQGRPLPVSSGGGRHPIWSPSGHELFYINGRGMLTAIPVALESGFSTGVPLELFSTAPYGATGNSRAFDVAKDGTRFIFTRPSGTTAGPMITVVTNWFEEVTARMPGR
jgi:eukaryotic-like serine/threonine-protein kinase